MTGTNQSSLLRCDSRTAPVAPTGQPPSTTGPARIRRSTNPADSAYRCLTRHSLLPPALTQPSRKGKLDLLAATPHVPWSSTPSSPPGSYRREGAGKSYRYLDLLVKRKNGKEHIFRNIRRSEYFNLFRFIKMKILICLWMTEDLLLMILVEASESRGEEEGASRDDEGSKKRKWKKKCATYRWRSMTA